MTSRKNIQRLGNVSLNSLRQILISVFSMIIPLLVIRFTSKEIWGAFVTPLLFTLLALQVINWGNKEYLLREFSKKPGQIAANFSRILFTRLPLVFVLTVIATVYFDPESIVWIFIWIVGRYLNHSVEALIIYQKEFKNSVLIEVISFIAFCAGFFWLKSKMSVHSLLIIYSLYQFLKGILYFSLFQKLLSLKAFRLDLTYYRTSLSFFLLSILGFLASKVDVYIVEHLGNKTVTANYQVINSLLVFTMSIAAFIYAPFTKNIYRSNKEVIQKTRNLLGFAGLIIIPISLIAIHFILILYLKVQFPLLFYVIAFAYIYPPFIYGIEIVNYFRQHKERIVVIYLLFGAAANSLFSALFLFYGYGIMGALAGSAIAQWLVLFLFRYNSNGNQ